MGKSHYIEVNLPVQFIKEGKEYIAYCPALDISTSGSSIAEAKEMFFELVHLFFEEILKKGTLEEVLLECGWTKTAKSKWEPPQREFLNEIQQKISIPCPA